MRERGSGSGFSFFFFVSGSALARPLSSSPPPSPHLLGLHLKPRVRKRLFERDAVNEERVAQAAALHFFDAEHGEVERPRVQGQHRVHHHGREKVALAADELGVERGARALDERVARAGRAARADRDRELPHFGDRQPPRLAHRPGDGLRVHALLDKRLHRAQQLAREEDDGRRAVADLGVLRERHVDERLGRRVHDLQQLHDGRAIVGDGDPAAVVVDELVAPARAERRAHRVGQGDARVDVGDELRDAL